MLFSLFTIYRLQPDAWAYAVQTAAHELQHYGDATMKVSPYAMHAAYTLNCMA